MIGRHLEGRGAVLADGEPLEADERAQGRGLRLRHRVDAQGHGHLLRAERRAATQSLPVAALVDLFYARLEARGGKRWDGTAALIQLLLKD